MATARRLPSGRWRVLTYDHGERRSFTAETKKEAERLAAIGLEEERAKARRGMTLADAIAAYIETCKAQGYSPSTIAEYSARMRTSYPQIIGSRVDALKPQDIQRQLDSRSNAGLSVKTVRNDFYLLRAVLSVFAPEINLTKIKLAKRKSRKKQLFSETMPQAILEAAQTEPPDFRIYLALLMFAGLRPSEVYALRLCDISAKPITVAADPPYQVGKISVDAAEVRDENGVYTRKAPKTESGNRVQLVAWSLIAFIRDLSHANEKGDRLVTLKPNSVTKRFNDFRKRVPLPEGMRLYDLRHLYATAVANSGASEEELAARMGHSTAAFSRAVYVELFSERRERVNATLTRATDSAIQNAGKNAFSGTTAHETAHARKEITQ